MTDQPLSSLRNRPTGFNPHPSTTCAGEVDVVGCNWRSTSFLCDCRTRPSQESKDSERDISNIPSSVHIDLLPLTWEAFFSETGHRSRLWRRGTVC